MLFTKHDMKAVELTNDIHPRLKVKAMYYNLGFSDSPKMFARKAVLDRLIRALDQLPSHIGLMIWDIYRCRSCQRKLFEWMRGEVRKNYPDLNDAENYEMANKFMSPPSKVGDVYCPPHLSGGAVDLTLFDIATDSEFDMGSPFDDCTEKADAHYYEKNIPQSNDDKIIRDRRRLLSKVMQEVGFTLYEYEWWHFDIGDVFWSRKTGLPEAFGPLFGDLEMPWSVL